MSKGSLMYLEISLSAALHISLSSFSTLCQFSGEDVTALCCSGSTSFQSHLTTVLLVVQQVVSRMQTIPSCLFLAGVFLPCCYIIYSQQQLSAFILQSFSSQEMQHSLMLEGKFSSVCYGAVFTSQYTLRKMFF